MYLSPRPTYAFHRRAAAAALDGGPRAAPTYRAAIIATYTIAFLVAAALTVYIVAYYKPPQQWRWYCRLRGKAVERSSPSPSLSSPPNRKPFGADDSDVSGNSGEWSWRALLGQKKGRCGRGGEARKDSVPKCGIKRTESYTVEHEAAPGCSGGVEGAGAWPLRDEGWPEGSGKKVKVYGGGELPWGRKGGGECGTGLLHVDKPATSRVLMI